jgi:hypothetical protein
MTELHDYRLQKRAANGRLFEYSYDFDDKGVLYWIGTKGGTAKWRNPCLVENGVTITASSMEKRILPCYILTPCHLLHNSVYHNLLI